MAVLGKHGSASEVWTSLSVLANSPVRRRKGCHSIRSAWSVQMQEGSDDDKRIAY